MAAGPRKLVPDHIVVAEYGASQPVHLRYGRRKTWKVQRRPDEGGRMGYFEQYPWLLIPVIVLTVEGWAAGKIFVKRALANLKRATDTSTGT